VAAPDEARWPEVAARLRAGRDGVADLPEKSVRSLTLRVLAGRAEKRARSWIRLPAAAPSPVPNAATLLEDLTEVALEATRRAEDPEFAASTLDWLQKQSDMPLVLVVRRIDALREAGADAECDALVARCEADANQPDLALMARAVADWTAAVQAGDPGARRHFDAVLACCSDASVRKLAHTLLS
jgi:hypothetical protein